MENVIAWYALVAIVAVCLVVLLLVIVSAWWCFKKFKKKNDYHPLFTEEAHDSVVEDSPPPSTPKSDLGSRRLKLNVPTRYDGRNDVTTAPDELTMMTAIDQMEPMAVEPITMADYSMSAYGDLGSVTSLSRTDSLVSRRLTAMAVNISAYASYTKGFLAGKVIAVDGVPAVGLKEVMVKVHITVLPVKKYALRSGWFKVNEGLAQIGAYFKFALTGTAATSMLRLRVYASKKGSIAGRQKCLGQLVMHVDDVERSRGGITVWEKLVQVGSPGISDIMEDE